MVGSIVHQLTDGVPAEELEKAGLGAYYTDHGVDVYPSSAAGVPFTAAYIACKGDPIANLHFSHGQGCSNQRHLSHGYWIVKGPYNF